MNTSDLSNIFLDLIVPENNYTISKKYTSNGVEINLISKEGMVDIEFLNNGIYATIEFDDIFHRWEILPSEQDMRNAAKKLKMLLDN